MEQHVRLVVLKHLGDKLDVHVLYIDLLQADFSVLPPSSASDLILVDSCSSSPRPRSISPVSASTTAVRLLRRMWAYNVRDDS
jgi:hypothetical protein